MLNIKSILLTILLTGSILTYGQQSMSLEEVLQEIYENNPSLKAYESEIKSQDARVSAAGSWMAPMIGAGTFMTPYPGTSVMNEENKGAWVLSAEQDIPNPAKTKARAEYLAAQSAITKSEQSVQANQLRSRAKELYYELLAGYRKIAFLKENQRIMGTMKKLAEIRYPYNQSSLSQIFKAEGRLYESENELLMAESDIRSKKIALNALMYRPTTADLLIDTAMKVSFQPLAALDTAYLANNRSDIQQMDRSIRAMELNINQMRQEAKPDFRLRFEHMGNRSDLMPDQYTLMGMISIPIAPWSSKMYKSELKSMNYEREAMLQQKKGMLSEMLGMTVAMENELLTLQKQLSNYESRILPALNKNLKASMLSYQENKGDLYTVIDAWEAITMAQMNYLDQLQKFYQLIVEYEKNIER